MVTQQQVRQGLLRYIDSEIVSKVSGLPKWGIAFASVALVDAYMAKIDVLKKMGMMSTDGLIDIDSAYTKLLEIAKQKGAVTQNFPVVGDITFCDSDIVKLYELIRQ